MPSLILLGFATNEFDAVLAGYLAGQLYHFRRFGFCRHVLPTSWLCPRWFPPPLFARPLFLFNLDANVGASITCSLRDCLLHLPDLIRVPWEEASKSQQNLQSTV